MPLAERAHRNGHERTEISALAGSVYLHGSFGRHARRRSPWRNVVDVALVWLFLMVTVAVPVALVGCLFIGLAWLLFAIGRSL